MKRILFLAILVLSGFILDGCKKEEPKINPTTPILSTSSVINITATTAKSGGTITSDGGSPITIRGICWGSTSTPTISGAKTENGNGIGEYESNINGLIPGSTYFVRAYATNPIGTSYGADSTFSTTIDGIKGTVNDSEGNIYQTIGIGYQMWMAENLKTTKYNDDTTIPEIAQSSQWVNLTSGAYCWYDNNSSYENPYGKLYNWHAVNSGKLCPSGWHVPTFDEWFILINFLGGQESGGKLKEIGTSHWKSPNIGATNITGFTALPGGRRDGKEGETWSGRFIIMGGNGLFWSSTEAPVISTAFCFQLSFEFPAIPFYNANMKDGYSIRCLKD
jgi:uncharacterized protein (TIGR02145 family)